MLFCGLQEIYLCLWVLVEVREKLSKLILYEQSQHHVMHVEKGSTPPMVVKKVLQMKCSQFLKLVVMAEHLLCTQFRQLRQRVKFAPTPFIPTPNGNLTDAIIGFETSCLKHMILFFPFTLIAFSSSPSFQFLKFTFSSQTESATMTKSSAYYSSHGQLVLNSRDRASITIIKRTGLNTDPWFAPAETLIGLL